MNNKQDLRRLTNKKYYFIYMVFLGLIITSCSQKTNTTAGAYYTGQYRNLFLENGHSESEINTKLNSAFDLLFHGDTSQVIYFITGANDNGPLAYLSDVLHNDVRSEGMSYGMMICVQMNKKAEFDALWNWALTHMYVRKEGHPSKGYFSWSLKTDGTPNAETAAPDGEEYFVMSLYFAANRWGNGQGIYNYKAYADTILSTIRHHPIVKGKTKTRELTVGPMVNEQHKMILFVPDSGANHFTDPSYHLPAFYELWALWGPENDRSFWAAAADSSRAFFKKAQNPLTGLSSDYANYDGTPYVVEWNPFSKVFAYDSWRTASNWSVDWSWWHKDTTEQTLSNRIQSFFASNGIDKFGSVFELSGKTINPEHRIGLLSSCAVASLAATHPIAKEFVEALWNAPVPQALDARYYDGTLYLMNFLHCSGNYKIWKP
jgi:oligosaccharide reducing-end xylanase